MRAAIFNEVGKEFIDIYDDVEVADPGPGEVRVKLHAAGVCHSDLSAMNGTLPQPAPAVLGHEGAGVLARRNQCPDAQAAFVAVESEFHGLNRPRQGFSGVERQRRTGNAGSDKAFACGTKGCRIASIRRCYFRPASGERPTSRPPICVRVERHPFAA